MSEPRPPEEINRSHRWHAVECNNLAWALSERSARTPTEDEDMLNAAHASAFHWSKTGTELHLARARMLLAHVHAALGHGQAALAYSQQCNAYLLSQDPPDWEAAFAHAVLAHAAHAAGDEVLHRTEHAHAENLGSAIRDPEDRQIFLKFFAGLPSPKDLGA